MPCVALAGAAVETSERVAIDIGVVSRSTFSEPCPSSDDDERVR